MIGQEPDVSAFVLEEDEILTQHAYEVSGLLIGELMHHRDRVPVPPQQLAGRRARTDSRQQLVLFVRQHPVTSKT